MNKTLFVWAVSLAAASVTAIVIAFSNIFGFELPEALTGVFTQIDLFALPILAVTSSKLLRSRNR